MALRRLLMGGATLKGSWARQVVELWSHLIPQAMNDLGRRPEERSSPSHQLDRYRFIVTNVYVR